MQFEANSSCKFVYVVFFAYLCSRKAAIERDERGVDAPMALQDGRSPMGRHEVAMGRHRVPIGRFAMGRAEPYGDALKGLFRRCAVQRFRSTPKLLNS